MDGDSVVTGGGMGTDNALFSRERVDGRCWSTLWGETEGGAAVDAFLCIQYK